MAGTPPLADLIEGADDEAQRAADVAGDLGLIRPRAQALQALVVPAGLPE